MNRKKLIIICLILILLIISLFLILKNYFFNKNDTSLDINNLSNYQFTDIISTYDNPVIPEGFKKIETDCASWELDDNGKPKGWNDGLVIEYGRGIGQEFDSPHLHQYYVTYFFITFLHLCANLMKIFILIVIMNISIK